MIDRATVRKTQMSKFPNPLSNSVDLNSSPNGKPHWMTETLAGSALMKEASKFSETLQEYISGYENPVGEVSGLDLKQISLDLSFTELQDVPYGSTTSQSTDKYRMMITLQKSTQTDGPTPATKPNCRNGPRPSG
jgi:SPX domain protein involved in polyphosphate accumulation